MTSDRPIRTDARTDPSEFIDGVQGRVQLRGNLIEVSIYGFEHAAAAAAILTNLETKLENGWC